MWFENMAYAGLALLISGGPPPVTQTFTAPSGANSDHLLACVAQNLGAQAVTVQAALINDTGVEVDSDQAEILPGRSAEVIVSDGSPFFGYCRFEFEGDPRTIRTYSLVREDVGGDTEVLLPAFELDDGTDPVLFSANPEIIPRIVSGVGGVQTFSPPVRSVVTNLIGCIAQNLGTSDVQVTAIIIDGDGDFVAMDTEIITAGGVDVVVGTSESVIDAFCLFGFDDDPALVRGYLNAEPPSVCYTRLLFPATELAPVGSTVAYSPPLSSPAGEVVACLVHSFDGMSEATAELIDASGSVLDSGTEMVGMGRVETVAGTTEGATQAFCKFTFDSSDLVRGYITKYPVGVGSNTSLLAAAQPGGGDILEGVTTYSPPLRSFDGSLQCTAANFSEETVDLQVEIHNGLGGLVAVQDHHIMSERAIVAAVTSSDLEAAFCKYTFDGSPAAIRGYGTLANVAGTSTLLLVPADPIAPTVSPTPSATETPTSRPTFTATAEPTESKPPTSTPTEERPPTSTPTQTSPPTLTPTARPSSTPASTPSETPTSSPMNTPTNTDTPTAEPTATSAIPCVGDCDGDGRVTVDEIILMVNVALGGPLEQCPAGDRDGDGTITVDEILAAVTNALDGCPA